MRNNRIKLYECYSYRELHSRIRISVSVTQGKVQQQEKSVHKMYIYFSVVLKDSKINVAVKSTWICGADIELMINKGIDTKKMHIIFFSENKKDAPVFVAPKSEFTPTIPACYRGFINKGFCKC